jgi:hypothetical protein
MRKVNYTELELLHPRMVINILENFMMIILMEFNIKSFILVGVNGHRTIMGRRKVT